MPLPAALAFAEQGRFSQQRAFAGDVLYTEGMPALHLYVVKEGEVDLYLVRDEKRTVVDTVRRGQCFGIEPHQAQQLRVHNAAARTYCELHVIDLATLQAATAASPELVRGLLHTLSDRLGVAHELIARRVNFQPELLAYAQLLELVGEATLGRQAAEAGTRRRPRRHDGGPAEVAHAPMQDVVNHAKALLGHSDRHVRACLGRLVSLHVVRMDEGSGAGKELVFAPRDIVSQVRKAVAHAADDERQSPQYLSLDDFAALVDVDRGVLLRKLAAGELAEDVFTFRRDEILRVLDAKGRRYFAQRRIKAPQEFAEVEDLEFADTRALFEAASRMDSFDLAKLLHGQAEGAARSKLLAALSERRRADVEGELQGLQTVDEAEARRLGEQLVKQVKALMLERSG